MHETPKGYCKGIVKNDAHRAIVSVVFCGRNFSKFLCFLCCSVHSVILTLLHLLVLKNPHSVKVLLFVHFSIYLNGNFAGVTMRQLIIQVGVLSSRRGAGMAQGFLDDTQIFRFLVEQGTAGMAQ